VDAVPKRKIPSPRRIRTPIIQSIIIIIIIIIIIFSNIFTIEGYNNSDLE